MRITWRGKADLYRRERAKRQSVRGKLRGLGFRNLGIGTRKRLVRRECHVDGHSGITSATKSWLSNMGVCVCVGGGVPAAVFLTRQNELFNGVGVGCALEIAAQDVTTPRRW